MAPFRHFALVCLLIALMTQLACSKNGGEIGPDVHVQVAPAEPTSTQALATAPAKQKSALPIPEFNGVYLVNSGALIKLKETPELTDKRALPRRKVGGNHTLAEAFNRASEPTRYDIKKYFALPADMPTISAHDMANVGIIVSSDNFVSLHLGIGEKKGDRLVQVDNRRGFVGEEVVDLQTKRLEGNVYQIVPASPIYEGYYYLWLKASPAQPGFTTGFPFFVKG